MAISENNGFAIKHGSKITLKTNVPNLELAAVFWLIREENDISNFKILRYRVSFKNIFFL